MGARDGLVHTLLDFRNNGGHIGVTVCMMHKNHLRDDEIGGRKRAIAPAVCQPQITAEYNCPKNRVA